MVKTRVLLVYEEGLFRDLLARTLAGEPSLEVVGIAGDSLSALRLVHQLEPDAVLTTISPPTGLNGIQLGQLVKKDRPHTGVVVLASSKHRQLLGLHQVEDSGWCFLLEESVTSIPVLVRAIEGSALGLMIIDAKLMAGERSQESEGVAKLPSTHRAVLELMAQGYTNRAITRKLAPLSAKSVENYVNRVYSELGLSRAGTGPWHPRVKAVLQYLQLTHEEGWTRDGSQGPSPPWRSASRKRPASGH